MTELSKQSILVVDDDSATAGRIRQLLAGEKVRVVAVATAREAFDSLQGEEFAAVLAGSPLSDIDMPEFARTLRAGSPGRHLPLIILAPKDIPSDVVSNLQALGVVDVWRKPLDDVSMSAKLSILLELQRGRRDLAREVAARREVEANLQDRSAITSVIFEEAPVMMMLLNKNLQVVQVNKALLEFTGRESDAVEGMDIGPTLGCMHCLDGLRECGTNRACGQCGIRDIAEQTFATDRGSRNIEIQIDLTRGNLPESMYLLVSTAPLALADESILLMCIENITERRHAEEARRKSIEQQKRILDTAATAIFMLDQDLRIVGVNDEFCKTSGYTPVELIGEHCHVMHASPCQDGGCPLLEGEEPRSLARQQCTIRGKDGRVLNVIRNASPIYDDNSTLTGVIESFVDVTELVAARQETEKINKEVAATNRQLEIAIARANEMAVTAEMSNASKSQFLAT